MIIENLSVTTAKYITDKMHDLVAGVFYDSVADVVTIVLKPDKLMLCREGSDIRIYDMTLGGFEPKRSVVLKANEFTKIIIQ